MNKFQPHINPVYPPNNFLIFEEWFAQNYKGCNTDRVLLPFFPTSFWVNNDYAQDKVAKQEAQDYIDSLSNDTKYFGICQYDDGFLIDWKGKDVLEFNMSKKIGVELPLLCMPHPYKFHSEKKWLANFVGSPTHPIREHARLLSNNQEYFISFDRMDIESYCRVMHESIFTLCFRGYGLNSFRCAESIQYGSIPVMISDEFILPSWVNFEEFGVLIKAEDANRIDEILSAIEPEEVINKQSRLQDIYEKYYTYEGCKNEIIKSIETEYNSRQEKTASTETP